MSTTVNISFLPLNSLAVLSEEILTQICTYADFEMANLHLEAYFKNEPILYSNLENAREKVPQIFDSNNLLEFFFSWKLISGKILPISLKIVGNKFNNGYEVDESGNIIVSFSQKDLLGKNIPDRLDEKEFLDSWRRIILDTDDLFLKVCGYDFLTERVQFSLKESSMYLEMGWPSPAFSVMTYHSDIRDYVFDLIRIYNEYNCSENPITSLINNDIPSLCSSFDEQTFSKEQYYLQFADSDSRELITFLSELSSKAIFKEGKISNFETEELLNAIIDKNPEFRLITANNRLGSGGFLLAHLGGSLWKFYDKLNKRLF